MIDHVSLTVRDLEASRIFYDAALAPLGIAVLHQVSAEESGSGAYIGYGPVADSRSHQAGKPSFWIAGGEAVSGPLHIAFLASTHAEVDAFHAASLAAGGQDNGAPGLRPHYHPGYYGAFVLDPNGFNIEAVCHGSALAKPA